MAHEEADGPALLLPGCGPAALSPESLREHLSKHRPDAVIFSGSPDGLSDVKQGKGKVRGDVAGLVDVVLELALPLLTICFGSQLVAASLTDMTRSKVDLIAENAMLRQQLIVLNRQVKRPQLTNGDRLRLVLLARCTQFWQHALHIVQPDTDPDPFW